MKKRIKKLLGVLLACSMVCLPVSQSLAAVSYDASAGVSNQVLFPGDSLINIAGELPVIADGEAAVSDTPGTWTNGSTDVVYIATTAEDGTSIQLSAAGYVLVVERGESEKNEDGADNSANHYVFPEDEKPDVPQDMAFYSAGETVKIKADDPEEGMVFAGWKTDDDSVSISDPDSAETTIVMPEKKVTVTALYEQQTEEPAADTEPTEGAADPAADTEPSEGAADQAADTVPTDDAAVSGGTEADVVIDPADSQEDIQGADNGVADTGMPAAETAAYSVFVTDGSVSEETGVGPYAADTVVKVSANDYTADGLVFDAWSVDSLNVETELDSPEIEFAMPQGDVYLTAHYKTAETAASEAAESGMIDTDSAEAGGSDTDSAEPETPASEAAEPETPASEAVESETPEAAQTSDTAQPETQQSDASQSDTPAEEPVTNTYEVTVQSGTGSGTYAAGETVTVEAQEIEGQTFSAWKADSDSVVFADSAQPVTTFTMPEAAVTVTAEYTAEAPADSQDANAGEGEGQATDQNNGEGVVQTPSGDGNVGTSSGGATGEQGATPTETTAELTLPVDVAVKVNGSDQPKDENGKYTVAEGATIEITASAQEGKKFTGWSVKDANGQDVPLALNGAAVTDMTQATLTFNMPGSPITVSANYEALPAQYTIKVANGIVSSGGTANADGSWTVTEGTQIVVTANTAPAGEAFSGWRITDANNADVSLGVDTSAASITLTPTQNLNFQANYTGVQYSIAVTNGTANYATTVSGTTVTITADTAPAGMEFDSWSVTSGNVSLANASSATTTFVMPNGNVTVAASYKQKSYSLAVNNGSADADNYNMGEKPVISADYPATGKEFDYWYADSGNVVFDEDYLWQTSFEMPASDVTVSARYKDGPSTNDNKILDIVDGGEYYTGSTIKFTASGAGMDNEGVNPGDYRYRPTGYQISNVTGNWDSAPYTTSMAIRAVGDYTLKVNFSREVFDGENWKADGTTDTKSVSFRVVNNTSVATGDPTPIMTVVLIAGAALLVFLILLVVVIRRRKNR